MKTKTKTKKKKFRDASSLSQSSNLYTAAVRIAVAQICSSVGYTTAQTSALETLTDVAVKYLQSLAASAVTSASSTGRTQCNLYDVIRALEDLRSDVGFIGNSDVNRRLYKLTDSSILRDIMQFVCFTREIPFAKPLPRCCHSIPASLQCFNKSDARKHVPRWLPEFPKLGGGDTVVEQPVEGLTEKRFVTTVSELPEKRKKVSFRVDCGGGSVIKGRKRVLCEIYDDDDDERFVNNGGCSSDQGVKVKHYVRRKKRKKLEE